MLPGQAGLIHHSRPCSYGAAVANHGLRAMPVEWRVVTKTKKRNTTPFGFDYRKAQG